MRLDELESKYLAHDDSDRASGAAAFGEARARLSAIVEQILATPADCREDIWVKIRVLKRFSSLDDFGSLDPVQAIRIIAEAMTLVD